MIVSFHRMMFHRLFLKFPVERGERMSVRAHRVNKIDYAGGSFNLWHDEAIIRYLKREGYLNQLDEDLSGLLELPLEVVKMLAEWEEVDVYAREKLKEDIKWAKENDEDYIMYYCF